jgi:hypothetical protein
MLNVLPTDDKWAIVQERALQLMSKPIPDCEFGRRLLIAR